MKKTKKLCAFVLILAMVMGVINFTPKNNAEAASYPIVLPKEIEITSVVGNVVELTYSCFGAYNNEHYYLSVYDKDGDEVATADRQFYWAYTDGMSEWTVTWDTSDYDPGTYKVVVEKQFYSLFRWNTAPTYTTSYVKLLKTKGNSKITVKSKTATYTGDPIKCSKASVTGSSGKVSYTYYKNSSCTTKTTKSNSGAKTTGGAPVNAGTYYVKAYVKADSVYKSATSKAAKLVIEKASSTIKLSDRTREYTGSAISIGKAVVTGSTGKVTYTYYVNSSCTTLTSKSNSGASDKGKAPKKIGTYYVKAKVAADANHKSKTSSAKKLIITKKKSTISLTGKTAPYSGKSVKIDAAKVTGSSGKVTYVYYIDSSCTKKTTTSNSGAAVSGGAPVDAGTYYVKATVASTTYYASATSKAAKLVILEPEPVETEPVETEPVETEPVETEPVETESVEDSI